MTVIGVCLLTAGGLVLVVVVAAVVYGLGCSAVRLWRRAWRMARRT